MRLHHRSARDAGDRDALHRDTQDAGINRGGDSGGEACLNLRQRCLHCLAAGATGAHGQVENGPEGDRSGAQERRLIGEDNRIAAAPEDRTAEDGIRRSGVLVVVVVVVGWLPVPVVVEVLVVVGPWGGITPLM